MLKPCRFFVNTMQTTNNANFEVVANNDDAIEIRILRIVVSNVTEVDMYEMGPNAQVVSDNGSLTGNVMYDYEGRQISVPLDYLCLDCSSPTIEVDEDYEGHFDVLAAFHDPTCPQRWDVVDRWQA